MTPPLDALRPAGRAARAAWRRARFQAWARRLDVELRRRGARLVLDAPHGAQLASLPVVRVTQLGDGDATFTLRIGRGVSLGRGVTIAVWSLGTNVLELGDDAIVEDQVHLQLRGGSIRLGDATVVREFVVVRSSGQMSLGRRGNLSHGAVVHCHERVELGDMAVLTEHVTVADSDHGVEPADEYVLDRPLRVEPVSVGRNVLVGASSAILRGARVGDGSIVAAGSVVTRGDYPGGWLIGGTPARPIKPLREASNSR
jgi:acetyltransferase-like isoleucine patch superfamily enzyme